jgi:hypothetical protein
VWTMPPACIQLTRFSGALRQAVEVVEVVEAEVVSEAEAGAEASGVEAEEGVTLAAEVGALVAVAVDGKDGKASLMHTYF